VTDESSSTALALRIAVVEVEAHASDSGWDQPSRLFALVRTTELAAAEPELAAELGIHDSSAALFTPVEQDLEHHNEPVEELLAGITWPEEVDGALVVIERVVLPPEAEEQVPDEPAAASAFAVAHARREDVRIAAGVLRSGESHCVLRLRSHDSDDALMHGGEVVPRLVQALRETLET
jgi:hypothetical protein